MLRLKILWLRFGFTLLLALVASARAQTSTYYIPPGVTPLRAMLTGSAFNPGNPPQYMKDYCVAQRVGLAQLPGDLPAIAAVTGNPEIVNAAYV